MNKWMKCTAWLVVAALVLGAAWVVAAYYRLGLPEVADANQSTSLTEAETTDIDMGLALVQQARQKLAEVRDYSAIYLRDELIDGKLSKNQTLMKARRQPFSVLMEWQAPRIKSGRKVVFVDGLNNGKMIVKDIITLRFDPSESIRQKDSRKTIREAGLHYVADKFADDLEKAKTSRRGGITLQDGKVTVQVQDREFSYPCRVLTVIYDPRDRELFEHHRAILYLDKETLLPIRMTGFEWPSSADGQSRLVEDHAYLDVKTNIGLTDKDFTW